MNLARHVRDRKWEALEEAWTELALGDADPAPALEALRAAADAKEVPRCLPFVREHADMLAGSERPAEAAELLGTAMLLGGSPGELAKPLYRCAEEAWGGDPAWEGFQEISGLRENAVDMRAAWRAFRKLLALEPGRVVLHATGWGLGRIDRADHGTGELEVVFASGRRDRFPYRTAVEIFEVLEPDDLRALVVADPDGLARRLREDPLGVLRWVLERQGGRANQAAIKLALGALGVEGPRFTAWWRRARKEAETSHWFELLGSGAKAQVRLLDEAEDPAEALGRQLERAKGLGEALVRVRELTRGAVRPAVAEAALGKLSELARGEGEPAAERLSTWLFLRERTGETPEPLRRELEQALAAPPPTDPSQPPALWAFLQQVPGLREQERCVEILRETLGEGWIAESARNLPHAPPGMLRALVAALDDAGERDALVAHYASLLARPSRYPGALVRLAERLEPARSASLGGVPEPLQRAQCLLQLAVHLHRQPASDAAAARARVRLTGLLTTGDPPLLRRLLAGADRGSLRGLANLLEPGVDRAVDRVFTRAAVQVSPGVFRGEDTPFWKTGALWTTRAGLVRKEAELRELKQVKIPENAEAIGRAASHGDLSENSEWEAAIEEQRHLTQRAMELEARLREAQLLENAAIPENTVAPGTAVRLRQDGSELAIRILGPWDESGDDVVSYRSPLGQGLLGLHPGDRATIELPTGMTEVEVVSVEPLEMG